jgi:hypothetical protein
LRWGPSNLTLAGDAPVNIHGERSRAIVGDAERYAPLH